MNIYIQIVKSLVSYAFKIRRAVTSNVQLPAFRRMNSHRKVISYVGRIVVRHVAGILLRNFSAGCFPQFTKQRRRHFPHSHP